ncbi:MAG: AAA domain-containing protein [Rubripirellula sp.]|nr:AAA domain-containing protein [Rubripirellula sp.]
MIDPEQHPEICNWQLVRHFHDCLAAQTDSTRAINLTAQSDLTTLPLSATEQGQLGRDGQLCLSDADAIELAKRVSLSGDGMSLVLASLFLVGTLPSNEDRSEKQIFAPLLEIPVELRKDGNEVLLIPEEIEFTVNYGLASELLTGDPDDLQDRLSELSECVPDFPIDATEFSNFWERFRLIAPEIPVSSQLPERRRTKAGSSRLGETDLVRSNKQQTLASDVTADDTDRIEMVDFYLPRIPKESEFRVLPATAVLFGPKVGRTMSALSELRGMSDMPLSRTAFGAVFDPSTAKASPQAEPRRSHLDQAQPLPLSPAQEAIVASARQAPLTVVTGPPGTGKSYTITAIVLDAMLRGETVLVASQMDKAVEVIADQVESKAGPLAIARSGGRAAQRKLAKKISNLTGPRAANAGIPNASIDQYEQRQSELLRQSKQLEQDLRSIIEAEQRWSELHQSRDRSRRLLRTPVTEVSDRHVRKAERLLQQARLRLSENPGTIQRWLSRWELSRASRLLKLPTDKQFSPQDLQSTLEFHLLNVEMHDIEQSLHTASPADQAWESLIETEQQVHQSVIESLQLTRQASINTLISDSENRTALRDLALLLRRRREDIKIRLQESLTSELLLDAFPAWACTSRALCEILPATPGLFDLVIIDEASQCDLAFASVALMRGRRAVVVGDPNQLRHVCFLSRAREQASFVRNEIPAIMQQRFHYRRSLFDAAADTVDAKHFFRLDEHFRSHPQIIDFSNRNFYDRSLNIMTERPSKTPQIAIQVEFVHGRRESESSINAAEIDRAVETFKSIIASGRQDSIGIVSPFRDQADAMKERFIQDLPAETLAKHAVVVGTAHSLQGDEKDIVILSTSIDQDSHAASLRFLESPNLFNVAITRARKKLVVVTSMTADDLPAGLFREFLVHAEKQWSPNHNPNNTNCAVEQTIAAEMQSDELQCWTGFQAAGTRINVALADKQKLLAVICDRGEPRDWETTLQAQRRLVRAGWPVARVPHRSVEKHWETCRSNLLSYLRQTP